MTYIVSLRFVWDRSNILRIKYSINYHLMLLASRRLSKYTKPRRLSKDTHIIEQNYDNLRVRRTFTIKNLLNGLAGVKQSYFIKL